MRTIWNGTLELDEIAIPVGFVPVVRDGREPTRRLHASCKTPVALRSYCSREEQLVDAAEIVSAWEVAPGEYLVLDETAQAALEPVESRRLPITAFVDRDAIAPELVRKRYHLVPSGMVGRRAYQLFATAIGEQDVAAIVRFTAWHAEQIGALTSRHGLLQLATLHFAEDQVDVDDEVGAIADDRDESLLELARELVNRHTRTLQPDDLASHERPRVRRLLEQLLAGEPIIRLAVQQDEQPTTGADLETALRRSLKQAPRPRRRRTPAATR